MDDQFFQSIEQINWFHSCGMPIAEATPFNAVQVSSWSEAVEASSDQVWEDVTLEARNRLTEFLHANYRAAYQHWNAITKSAKKALILPLAASTWRPYSEKNELGKAFVDCVSWDILAAVMEHEYRDATGRPQFFLPLLDVYRAGHFPCGWHGDWPNGSLLVW